MDTDVFSAADWLLVSQNVGYGPSPLPSPRDNEISMLLSAWVLIDPLSRSQSASKIVEEQRFTLLAYSERMASTAVRMHDQNCLVLGLIALGIDGWRSDWRDNATILSLHHDAARKLHLNPSTIFSQAGSLLSEDVARAYTRFLARSDEDKSIEAMGYLEASDADGFRYKRDW